MESYSPFRIIFVLRFRRGKVVLRYVAPSIEKQTEKLPFSIGNRA